MNRSKPCFFLLLLIISACGRQQEQTHPSTIAPKVVEAKGYIVPKNSMAEPKVVPVGKPRVVRVGTPRVVSTNTNVHPVGKPEVVKAGTPRVCIPGQNGFSLPKTVSVIDSSFPAGIPEVVLAKDAYSKEVNPQNFSSFGKLQGLKHGNIACMLQDKKGNLWFGTDGGGVSKYDGRCFTHYTENEGLSDNYVRRILEDKKGNLWFGSNSGGVSRLSSDGKTMTQFKMGEGLNENGVKCIIEDRSGNIWISTNGGAWKYDGKKFTHYTEKEGLSNNELDCMLEDKNGNLWFSTWDSGVCRLNRDGKSFTKYTVKEGLGSNAIDCMFEDRSGNIWFGTYDNGVSRLSHDGRSFTNYTEKEGLGSNNVKSILEDKNGILWFGTIGGGVTKLSKDGKSFTHFTEKEGLSNNSVNCILEDNNRTLWFGTQGGGVSKLDGKLFTHYTAKEGLNNFIVWSILEDKKGNLWVGTENGVSRLNADATYFSNFTRKEGLSDKPIYRISEDKDGNLWFATWGDGVIQLSKDGKRFTHFTKKEGLIDNYVRNILEDEKGNFWFCSVDGVSRLSKDGRWFTHFTVKEGLSGNFVRPILEDKKGNIWFGTHMKGVTRLSPDRKTFTHYTIKEGLIQNWVRSLSEDREGNLWIGTMAGISKLSFDYKTFTQYTEKEGLTNNHVFSSIKDKSGNLWFGTRFGISKIPFSALAAGREVVFKNYNYEDGFSGIGVFEGALFEDSKGAIWIGANNGLTAYHPEGDMTDTIRPNIQLTNLDLFNENIPWRDFEKNQDTTFVLGNGVKVSDFQFDSVSDWYFLPENLNLAYDNNFLTFNFIGITQKQPKKVKYQYKLEGFDKNWSALTSRNEAPYGNLPHGTFTFKVKAMNGDGYWSNEFNYTFTIRPPWYKTGWFRAFTALFILFLLFMVHHWRTAALRRRHKQLEKIVEKRTAEVVHQKEEIECQKEEVECQKEELENTLDKLKQTQSQLIQSEKMASLGMLTAGIAHEINNPVNFINSGAISLEKDYIDLQQIIQSIGQLPPDTQKLADKLGMDELLKNIPQTIDDIKTGVQRTSEIVKGLRNFTRMDASELKEADIHEGIDSALLLLSYKTKNRISILKNYDERIGFIKCYPGPLNQVFMNLLNNAIDAIDQKIKEDSAAAVAVAAGKAPDTPISNNQYQITINTKMIEEGGNKQVKIVIIDNGAGIREEIRDKLFDPFFTTKEVGKGTGLGLAICHGIIEKHGGAITFESKANEGSSFIITLPME